jgi:hypothetical protein
MILPTVWIKIIKNKLNSQLISTILILHLARMHKICLKIKNKTTKMKSLITIHSVSLKTLLISFSPKMISILFLAIGDSLSS